MSVSVHVQGRVGEVFTLVAVTADGGRPRRLIVGTAAKQPWPEYRGPTVFDTTLRLPGPGDAD